MFIFYVNLVGCIRIFWFVFVIYKVEIMFILMDISEDRGVRKFKYLFFYERNEKNR